MCRGRVSSGVGVDENPVRVPDTVTDELSTHSRQFAESGSGADKAHRRIRRRSSGSGGGKQHLVAHSDYGNVTATCADCNLHDI